MGVRGLQWPAPHVQGNVRHWGHEGHKKGDKPGHCASCRKEMQIIQTGSQDPALKTAGCASRDDNTNPEAGISLQTWGPKQKSK